MRLGVIIVLACVSALCQEIYHGATAPQVVGRTDPQYSEEARIARLSGTIRFYLVVGEDGTVRDARAGNALGLGLDEKAMEAIRTWRFKPGTKDGVPVPVAVTVEMNFRIMSKPGDWSPTRATFDTPEGTARPVLMKAEYPSDSYPTTANGSVSISFDVNSDGATENLHIEKSSDPASESEVIRIVRAWRFQPGSKDGQPVSVRGSMEFVKGKP
jgi:TonB family protein